MTRTICSTYRPIVFVGALLIVLSAQAAAAPQPQPATVCVDVDMRFTRRHPAAILVSALQKETAAVWEPYGVQLGWPGSENLGGCASPRASFIVLFNDEHTTSPTTSPAELGNTRLIPGLIDRAPICVDQETAERFLAILTPEQLTRTVYRPFITSADVGRALGRVLAHELGHVLLAAHDHQQQGLMRPAFPLEDLVSAKRDTFTLSPPEVDHLRERIFSGVVPTYKAPMASLRCGQHTIGH